MTKEPHGDIAVTLKMYRQPKLKRKNLYITVNFAKKVNDKPSFDEAIEDAFQTMKFVILTLYCLIKRYLVTMTS